MDNQQESSLWKVIEEFPRWEINSKGEIRNVITKVSKYTNKVHKSGYEYVSFKKRGHIHMKKVHRLVAEYFLPEPSEELKSICLNKGIGMVLVNHKDGNKLNNNVENLEWCDDMINSIHARLNGLLKPLIGEDNGRAILTEKQVHEICKDFEQGMQPSEAVIKYGISRAQATKIRAGFAWKHVSSLYNIKVNKRKSSTTSREA